MRFVSFPEDYLGCSDWTLDVRNEFAPFARILARSSIPGTSALRRANYIADTWKFARATFLHSHSLFTLPPFSLSLFHERGRYRFRSRFREAFAQPRSIFTTRLGVPIARPFRFGGSLSRTRPWFLADFRRYSQSADIEGASGCAKVAFMARMYFIGSLIRLPSALPRYRERVSIFNT